MKSLYLYTDGNRPEESAALRVGAGETPFIELRLDVDFKIHNTTNLSVVAVIDVDNTLWDETPIPEEIESKYNAAPDNLPVEVLLVSSKLSNEMRDSNELRGLVARHQASLGPEEQVRLQQLVAKIILRRFINDR